MLYACGMDQQSIIAEMERRARRAGVFMGQICDLAGIARSTFYRWKQSPGGGKPISATLESLNRLQSALEDIERAQADNKADAA